MTEREAWSRWLQPVLHFPSGDRVAWKVQDAYRVGLPDMLGRISDRVYLAEQKHVSRRPKRATTVVKVNLSVEQHRHLVEWGGRERGAYLIVTWEKPPEITLYDPRTLPTVYPTPLPEPVFSTPKTRRGLKALVEFLRHDVSGGSNSSTGPLL